MASNTDTRIVQMQFDNKDFEKNIATSEKSLEKFKEALDFQECEKSLEDFEDATRKLTFDQMASNIQKLTDKFTGLGTVSEYVLSQVRHGLENAAAKAKAFFNSMTIDQVNVGFEKFGQLNKNVQTIMAATGRSEEDVYKVMQRLNTYTDWTSYSFTDMASNIGKFTSVGVPLEKAEKQMEGIANWAARSGGGIQEASRAMYNLSQAMGVGAMTKIDWKSIENAGMATKEYKEQLIQAGLATGNLIKQNGKVMTAKQFGKQVEVTYQNLAETLSKKWADTEVMQKSFMAYYYDDITYSGEIAEGVKTTKEQRDQIYELLGKDNKIDAKEWKSLNMDSQENRQAIIDAAVEQKKLLKEVNDEGETVYKTMAKNGKQIEITADNFEKFLEKGLLDESLITVAFNLNAEPLIETTEEQKRAIKDALGDDDIVLKKDWSEGLTEAGLATNEFKQAAMDAAVAAGTLKKETDKAGKTVYKTAKGFGKETVVTLENFEETLKNKWFTRDVADKATKLDDLGKAAYEAAQKCMTFTDILNAWKDQLSTGWMNSYNLIFGELSESMELFSNICNKVGSALDELLKYRNRLLEIWGNGGGRTNLWSLIVGEVTDEGEVIAYEGAYGFLDALMDIGRLIKDGFWNMMKLFAPNDVLTMWDDEDARDGWFASQIDRTVTNVRNFISAIHDFFNASADGSQKTRWQQIQDVVNAIYAAFVLAYTVIRDVAGFLGKLFDQDHLGKSIDSILRLLSALGLGVYDLADSAVEGEGLEKLFNGLLDSLEPLIAAVNTFVDILTGGIIDGLNNGKEAGTFAGIWQTICDIFKLLGKIVSKVGAPVLNFVSSVLGIINELFDGELTGDKLKDLGGKLEAAITKLFDDIFSLIPGIGKNLQSTIAYIFGFAEEGAEDGTDESSKTILGVAKKWLRKIFGGFANLFDNIKKDANQFNLFTWAKDMLGIGSFGKFLADMSGIVKGTNLYGLIMSFLGGYALFKLIGVLRKGSGLLNNMRGFFQGAKDVMQDGLKLKFGDQLESTGDKVMKIATGIALIAGSVAVLGSMNTDSLLKGFAALAGVMLALGGFMWIMKQFVLKDWKDAIGLTATIAAVAAAILSITLGIGLLTLMLKPLANMSMEGIMKMLTGLLGIVTILGLMAKYIGKDMKNLKGTRSIAAMALAIGLLIFALKPLANMEWEGMAKMALGLVGILYILTEFSNKVGNMSIKGGGSLILLAASIGLLILSLQGLKDLSIGQLAKMGISLYAVLEMLSMFTKKIAFIKGAGMGQLILVAGSIWILMQALMPLANLEWGQLGKIGAGLAATMLIIGMFINNTQSMHGTGMGNILMVAASIWVLMQALLPLANLQWEGLAKMGAGLLAVSAIVVLMTHLVDDMNILQGAGIAIMMAGLAAVLLTFGFAMASLTGLSWEQISVACSYLMGIIVVFGLIQKTMMKDNDILDAVHSLLLMAGLAVIMIAFSIALNEIKNVPTDKIVAFSAGLAALVAAVGIALTLTRGMTIAGALKGILILSAAIAALMLVFGMVGSLVMNMIGSSLTTLAANLKLFSGMISDFSTRMNSVDEGGIEKAKRVVNMLVSFLSDMGGIVVGSISASALTTISSHLTLTSGLLIDFSGRMNQIDEAAFSKAQRIIGKVKLMMASLDGFEGYTSQREAFTTALFDLGTGIEIFAGHTGNVGDLSENSALQLIKELSACAGDMDTIASMDIDGLSAKLTGLGGAMMLYAKGAEEATGMDVNAEGAPDVAGAVRLLRDISNSLTENGGFTIPENMPSEEALGLFGAQLAALAGALIMFEESGSQLGDGTEQALAALDFFKDLKEKLVEIDMGQAIGTALASFLTGESVEVQPSELETFGKNIEQLGLALAAFAKSTTIIDEASGKMKPVDYSKATEALTSFSELANSLPTIGGIRSWWEGNRQSLTDLSADLEALGQGLKDFTMKVTGKSEGEYKGITDGEIEEGKTASTTIVDKAVEVFEKITEAQGKLENVGGIASIWTGDPPKLSDIAAQLETLGQGLRDFSDKITGTKEGEKPFDPEAAKAAIGTVDEMIGLMQEVSTRLPTVGGLGEALNTLVNGREAQLTDVGTQIGGLGTGLSAFATEISGKFSNADEVITALNVVGTVMELVSRLSDISGKMEYSDVASYVGYMQEFLTGLTTTDYWGNTYDNSIVDYIVQLMGSISDAINQAGNIDKSNVDIFTTFVQGLNNLASINLATVSTQFEAVGQNISAGVATGIALGQSGVINAAVAMAVAAYEAAKQALDEHSPSRIFMGLGQFASEGLAIGITKSSGLAEDAGESMANDTINSTKGILAGLSATLLEDIDTQPTIRPVLDLSNVTAGEGTLSNIFGRSYGIGLKTNGISSRASRTFTTPVDVQNGSGEADTMARMDAMIENIQKMGNSISNMKLVLDTGVLAGGVADDVDIDIGRKAFYAGRRN